jgi:maltose alpha-D-glucosyltransferase/alpha-amylase
LAVEQSHTSVVLDELLIAKAYRHVPPSPSPELEVGRFLTEVARFPNTPPVAGALEYHRDDAPSYNLALLQGFIHNQGDGWSYTLHHLEHLLERHMSATLAEQSGDLPDEPAVEGDSYRSFAYTLGLRTGQLHDALAMETDDPAFTPEPITDEDLTRWRDAVVTDARRTLEALAAQRERATSERLVADVDRLLGLADVLEQRVTDLGPAAVVAMKTRFHGDFHLGQVLVVGHDVQIIDFEGEQPRPGAPRLPKHSPLRDVAGMLRSFDYAANAALFTAAVGRPDDWALLEPMAREWHREAKTAFLDGYHEAIRDCPAYPEDAAQAEALIKLFVVEKALYEINYELNHRPDWLGIPLRGVLALLDNGEL